MADVMRIRVTAYVLVATHDTPSEVKKELKRLVWAALESRRIDYSPIDEIMETTLLARQAE